MKKINNNNKNLRKGIIKQLFPFVFRSKGKCHTISISEALKEELEILWKTVHNYRDDHIGSEEECRNAISESFEKMKADFTDEELDSNYAWPKYMKLATKVTDEPIEVLIGFITRDNYIVISNHLSNLIKVAQKKDDKVLIHNINTWSKEIYIYILENINPHDVPCCLALGRMAQDKGMYKEAIRWYERILNTNHAFNGVTAILGCYEREVKALIAKRNRKQNPYYINKRISEINACQNAVFTEWYNKMRNDIKDNSELNEEYKCQFVTLATKYARFETHMNNYRKAFNILDGIPGDFPEIYRVYSEKAMLYQFKPEDNNYYNLEKAAEMFEEAEKLFVAHNNSNKALKCILMPLANVYFRLSRYKDAYDLCNRILEKIDPKEQNALSLKNRVAAYI